MADYYTILNVDRDAGADEIRHNYRRLALKYHPDLNNGSKSAELTFREITEAYTVLSDPKKRREYDKISQDRIRNNTVNIDPKKNRDLETIVQTLTNVAKSPIPYEDFLTAYGHYNRLMCLNSHLDAKIADYRKITNNEIQTITKGILRGLKDLTDVAKCYDMAPEQLMGLLRSYKRADNIAQRYHIDLRDL